MELAAGDGRVSADRHLAAATQGPQDRAFGRDRGPSLRVVQQIHLMKLVGGFNGERALPGGRTHLFH